MAFKVYAHRGFHQNSPENTLNAFRLAYTFSPNIEIDVRLTKDRVVVVIHDEDLATTTNSQGLVCETDFQTIRNLRTRPRDGANREDLFNEQIPSLRYILNNMPSETNYQIELKEQEVVEPTLKCLSNARIPTERYFFTSFHLGALKEAQAQSPNAQRLLLISPQKSYQEGYSDAGDLRERGLVFQGVGLADTLSGMFKDRLKEEDVHRFADEGFQVGCYLINYPERARILQQWGVKGIVTDRIDLFKDFK